MLSFLDQDLYKLTMQQAVCLKYPDVKVRYKFINRGLHQFPEGFASKLQSEVDGAFMLSLMKSQHEFLKEVCPFFTRFYLDFLSGYKYDSKCITITQKDALLDVVIEGYWYETILWEVPLMAMISQLYYEVQNFVKEDHGVTVERWKNKLTQLQQLGIPFADFGTRRRYSSTVHDTVIRELINCCKNFVGTSNVHFAQKYFIKPIGTQAHEWFMAISALKGIRYANKYALEDWVDVYHGDLGIALTDTFTTDNFFENFNVKHAKLFDGLRQDSGDPIAFVDKALKFYTKMGIDTTTKTIIFSDGLDLPRIKRIVSYMKDKPIKYSFGIGTNLTNDVGVKPLNMVIKLTDVKINGGDWVPVIKLSDDNGKTTGSFTIVNMYKHALGLNLS